MDTRSPGVPAPTAAPRPKLTFILIPVVVFAALGALIFWSALPVLRPARTVKVAQVLPTRLPPERDSSNQSSDQTQGSSPTRLSEAAPSVTVQAPGWLEADPFFIAATALADGIVESIEVLEGDRVERGQIVAQLVAEDSQLGLRQAQAGLAAARAAVGSALAEQQAAERSWADPVELERALASSRGAVAESRAELEQLPALVEGARATLDRLTEEAARVRQATEQGAATELEFIVADREAARQRAEVAALEARRPILEARITRLSAEVTAAARNLDLRIEDQRRLDAAAAAVASARAELQAAHARQEEAALELDRMTVRAPITGYVQRRLKVPGDKVIRAMDSPHSAHLVHLYDPGRIQVRVDVPLADAANIAVGQACEVVVEVLPGRVFAGEVLRITHEADLQKNTLQAKVRVIDPDPILRPEMLTRVKFLPASNALGSGSMPTATATSAQGGPPAPRVLIPSTALTSNADNARIWIVTARRNGRGTLTPRSVRVVERTAQWHTVTGDIRPGDLIAVNVQSPRAGELVTITPEQPETAGDAS
ncbi:MAG: efflux RND transporter periplasmic adaptor subunit [Planctomycetota bacterium]